MTQNHKATISRLTISGFKSFADEVSLDILPGLTGIVGPNGCGKSNIVESLRWVMGESSARALRGGESDDLIFAGTHARPAKNIAKVTLHLTHSTGLAPSPFQEADELDITRQAERNSGSLYRINQKTMRAKDVQTLFADLASGARSSSIISQNRVGELINAKPEERRLLLEEAAGITGLHVRRHDAELKLKQAENNLERVDEHCQGLEERLHNLSEQSKSATHYREISENMRLYEEKLLILTHQRALLALENNQKALEENTLEKEKIEHILEKLKQEQKDINHEKQHLHKKIEEMRPILQNKKIEKEITYNNLEHILKNNREKEEQLQKIKDDILKEEKNYIFIEKEREDYLTKIEEIRPKFEEIQKNIPNIQNDIEINKNNYHDLTQQYDYLNKIHQENYIEYKNNLNNYNVIKENIKKEEDILEQLKNKISLLKKEQESLSKEKENFTNIEEIQHKINLLQKEHADTHQKLQELLIKEERTSHHLATEKSEKERLLNRKIIIQQNIEKITQKIQEEQKEKENYLKNIISKEKENDFNNKEKEYQNSLDIIENKENKTLHLHDDLLLHLRDTQKEKEETRNSLEFYQKEKTRLEAHLYDKKKSLISEEENYQKLLKEKENLPHLEKIRASLEEKGIEVQYYQNKIDHYSDNVAKLKNNKESLQNKLLKIHSIKLEIESEINGITKTLHTHTTSPNDQKNALLEQILCPPDFYKALAAAFSDDLDAILLSKDNETLSKQTPRAWCPLTSRNKTPSSLSLPTLSHYVTAPKALERALTSFFILDDSDDARALQKQLHQGEALIDKNGNLWRWDGFIRTHHVQSATEIKLAQRQRLHELKDALTHHQNKELLFKKEYDECVSLLEKESQIHASLEESYKISLKDAESLKESLKENEKERDYIQIKQTQLEEYIGNISNEYKALSQTSLDISEKIEQLPSLEKLSSQEKDFLKKLELIQKELSHIRHEKQVLQKDYPLFLQEKNSCFLQHHNAIKQIKAIDNNEIQYSEDLKILQEELTEIETDHIQNKIEKIIETLNSYKKEKELLLAKNKELEDKIDKSSLFLEEQKNNYQNYKNTLLILSEKSQHLIQQIKQQEEKITSFSHQEKEYQQRIEAIPSLTESEARLKEIQEGIASQKHILDDLHKYLTEHKENETLLSQQKQTYAHQIDMHGKTLHYIKKTLSDLKNRLAEISKENLSAPNALKQQYEQENTHLEKLEKDFSSLEDSLKTLHLKEETNLKNQSHTQEELQKFNTHAIRLSERLKQAEQNLEKLENETPLPQPSLIKEIQIPETEQKLRQIIQKLYNEREALGAVNLCAEEEFRQLDENYRTLLQEQTDLTEAISRLRKAVNSLNREGRERLTKTFTEINNHFQTLFTRMFGGGSAYLKLVGHDDPLEAGLEIFAQPPGKKLASLSLLSGGEQALTALSLIFSAFYCTPAPIYILDEVDAPLDDANVERFCSLLTEIAEKTGTRFLIVTHHQLTMAHMDRLFGVTMQERGVSRLLSVSLSETIHFSNG